MEPHDAFHQIYYVYILTAQRLCGCELVLPNYRPHRVTYVAVLCFCSYIVASVYTVAVYDVDAKWKCLCCLPIALQVSWWNWRSRFKLILYKKKKYIHILPHLAP